MIRYFVAALAALSLAALSPAVAAADSQNGTIGAYSVTDTLANPGAKCVYAGTWGPLHAVTVPAPTVFARDTTGGVDAGQVGWSFVVKRVAQSTTVVYRSGVQSAAATDQSPAAFTDVTGTFAAPGGSARYIVAIKVLWLGNHDNVTAWAKHRVTHYARVDDNGDSAADGRSCPLGFA